MLAKQGHAQAPRGFGEGVERRWCKTSRIGETDGAMQHADDHKGQARILVDESRHVLAGATFVGPQVAELLHSATVAIVGGGGPH